MRTVPKVGDRIRTLNSDQIEKEEWRDRLGTVTQVMPSRLHGRRVCEAIMDGGEGLKLTMFSAYLTIEDSTLVLGSGRV